MNKLFILAFVLAAAFAQPSSYTSCVNLGDHTHSSHDHTRHGGESEMEMFFYYNYNTGANTLEVKVESYQTSGWYSELAH